MRQPNRRRALSTIAGISSAILLIGLLVACVAVFPTSLTGAVGTLSPSDRLKAENDIRSTLLQGVGGLLALAGVAAGAAVTLRQVRSSREGNTIELFTKAIDQLSSENISVRQGGVYAMELLARLDPAYGGHVHALLTTFVRQRAPWPPVRPEWQVDAERARFTGGLADDVGAAMGALSRRSMVADGAYSLLEKVDFREADLAECDLRMAYFGGSNLDGANLTKANLTNATFSHATLRNCDLSGADLTGAELAGADVTGVISDGETKWPRGWPR